MTKTKATDGEWLQWIEVQKAATLVWNQGRPLEAIAQLEDFVGTDPPQDLQRDAIAFRASIHEDRDDLEAAKADLLAALDIASHHGFDRYSIELSLAALFERLGRPVEARRWCLAGLRSAADDPRESGAGALLRLLRLTGDEDLSPDENRMVRKVVFQAWSLLRMDGEPDFADLETTTRKLLQAHFGPFSEARSPAPTPYQDDPDKPSRR